MGIFIYLKNYFGNLSSTAVRRLVTVVVILCVSVLLSIPQLQEDLRQSRMRKIDSDSIKSWQAIEQGMDAALLKKAEGFLGNFSARSLIIVRHNRMVLEKYYTADRDNYTGYANMYLK